MCTYSKQVRLYWRKYKIFKTLEGKYPFNKHMDFFFVDAIFVRDAVQMENVRTSNNSCTIATYYEYDSLIILRKYSAVRSRIS